MDPRSSSPDVWDSQAAEGMSGFIALALPLTTLRRLAYSPASAPTPFPGVEEVPDHALRGGPASRKG